MKKVFVFLICLMTLSATLSSFKSYADVQTELAVSDSTVKELNLDFKVAEVEYLVAVVAEKPLKESGAVYQKILTQAQKQVTDSTKKDASIKLSLGTSEVEYLLGLIAERPLKESFGLYQKIIGQAQTQLSAPKKK